MSFANCCGSARAAAGPLQHSFLRRCRRLRPARNLPRKTRLMTAARAGIAMTAQRSGATAQNGTKRFELLKVKARSIAIQEAIALRAKDVGHLEGGPSHFSYFRLKLRRMLAVLDSTRPSNGL